MNKKQKIIAIFISYNAEKTLKKFWKGFPRQYFDECILVDDASKDKTLEISKKIKGLKVYQNPVNLGHGGNLKRAINIALNHNADIIVDIHPDNEYKPSAIPVALEKIQKDKMEFVLGNRFKTIQEPIKNGMYFWKVLPILALNYLDRLILGIKIHDLHQGFRVYTRKFLERVDFETNSNNYLFSFELIVQAVLANIKIDEVPVETNYQGEKRGASLLNSIVYAIGTFKILIYYVLNKLGIKSMFSSKTPEFPRRRVTKNNLNLDAILVHCYWFDKSSKNLLDIHSNLQLLAINSLLKKININKIVILGGKIDPHKESIGTIMKKELLKLNNKLTKKILVIPNSITTRQEVKMFQKLVIKNHWNNIAFLSFNIHLPRVKRAYKRIFNNKSNRTYFFSTEEILNQSNYRNKLAKYTSSHDSKPLKINEILINIIDRIPFIGGYLIDTLIKIFPWKGVFLSKFSSVIRIRGKNSKEAI